MKILITTDWYKPVINGVVTSVASLTDGLENMGHEVKILTLSSGRRSHKKNGVFYLGSASAEKIYPNARMKIVSAHRYIKEIVEWTPDIVHSQCEFNTFPLAIKIAKHCNAPVIHTYHTAYEDYTHYFSPSVRVGRYIVSVLSRQLISKVDGVIAPTDKAHEMLQRYGIDRPIVTIPSGIQLDPFLEPMRDEERNQYRAKLGISATDQVLVYIGRLAKEKNIEEIFNFLSEAKSADVKLVLVGDGPHRESLRWIAHNREISSKVIFTGMVPTTEVAKYYKIGDIFVSASQSETQGLTYIEAMASGLPILCKRDSCLDGIVQNGQNGLMYTSDDEFNELAEKLLTDEEFKRSIGQEAQESIHNRFSSEGFAKAVSEFYTTIAQK